MRRDGTRVKRKQQTHLQRHRVLEHIIIIITIIIKSSS